MSQSIGHGSQLELDTTSPGTGISGDTWLAIKGATTVDLGSNKVDALDNTDMGTTGTARTFIPGLENSGDVSFKVNITPGDTSQTTFRAAKGIVKWFRAILPDGTNMAVFQGFITSLDLSIPDDKLPTWTGKIQITGAVTYTGC